MKMGHKSFLAIALMICLTFSNVGNVMAIGDDNNSQVTEQTQDTSEKIQWPDNIERFERYDPVYTEVAKPGTARKDIKLPDTLRAIVPLDGSKFKLDSFVQAKPEADMSDGTESYDYYHYGYVAPENSEELYTKNEKVIYSIFYAARDENGEAKSTVGETAFRVYGMLDGSEKKWFSCDESGNIAGVILDIPVTWTDDGYTPDKVGDYIFTSKFSGYTYSGKQPFAKITVADSSEERENQEDEEKQENEINEENEDTTESIENADSTIQPRSIGGGGANDTAQDNFMVTNTATSGNPTVSSGFGKGTPGTWVDYVNTIWMNKAFYDFAWTESGYTGAYNNWAWSGGTATQTNGSTKTNPLRIPVAQDGVWTVYSGEQLRYALRNMTVGQTVKLGANINLNGSNYAWNVNNNGGATGGETNNAQPNFIVANATLDGNGFTIYNAGAYAASGDLYIFGGTKDAPSVSIKNLTLKTAKLVGTGKTSPFNTFNGGKSGHTYTNVHVIGSMVYTTGDTAAGFASINQATSATGNTITNCSVQGGRLRSRDHALGFAGGAAKTTITNSFVTDTMINGYGGHSSGFIYCNHASPEVQVSNCFASTEIYGSKYVVGFGAPYGSGSTIENCFATGKIEGYEYLSGFGATQSSAQLNNYSEGVTYNNCYTTSLVGMRSEAKNISGFIGVFPGGDGNRELPATVNHCYAAGEVGDFTTDLNNPVDSGGFVSQTNSLLTISDSYYDKQTTAMREWAAGNTKSVPGVTGVLTTNTLDSDNNTITGLADGTKGAEGFKGFADNSKWNYTSEHYPQLQVYTDASAFGEYANLVKAYSLASTSTVFLDTWNDGFDWTEDGVRTSDEVSYARTLDATGKQTHKGNELTYDTVREIIAPFKMTQSAIYKHLIGKGAPSQMGSQKVTDTVNINNENKTGTVNNPGMDWYQISDKSTGATGFRPIRLIGYMAIDAGENKTITVGDRYNHRTDVGLTMMDSLTNNMVIGMDNDKTWSASKKGSYPNTTKYYAAVTDNMETNFSASKNAWIYTEIWRAEQNDDGSYVQGGSDAYSDGTNNLVPEESVKVTGKGTGEDKTLDEQKWNGEFPFYPDFSHERKYIVSYYWMLSDGRYITDYKIVTIEPGKYDLKLDVLNYEDGKTTDSKNTDSLFIGTGEDKGDDIGYHLSDSTATHAETLKIPYTQNAAAGWKKTGKGIRIAKTQVDLYDAENQLQGTAVIDKKLEDGDELKFTTMVYYISHELDEDQGRNREVTRQETLDVIYNVTQNEDGTFQLRFNKLANPPKNEFEFALAGTNDSTGIPEDAKAYINDMMFNTKITLWVEKGKDFEFTKTNEDGTVPFGKDDAEFTLYSCTKGHTDANQHSDLVSSDTDNCWGNPRTVSTDENGKVNFPDLQNGDYMLTESKTKDGYQLPREQWLLQVDALNDTYTITTKGDDKLVFKEVKDDDGNVIALQLPNYRIYELPSTGGMGTYLFTISGVAFITAAFLLYINTKKRREEQSLH